MDDSAKVDMPDVMITPGDGHPFCPKQNHSVRIRLLEKFINSNSWEQFSNTPDFILAEYLVDCLEAYEKAVTSNRQWHTGRKETEL